MRSHAEGSKDQKNGQGGADPDDGWINFRCASYPACKVAFPLKENTKEKLIQCPMEGCEKSTNVYLKLKRIQVKPEAFCLYTYVVCSNGHECEVT